MSIELFRNQPVDATGDAKAAKGGTKHLWLIGSLGGGTFTLESQYKDSDWRTVRYADTTVISITAVDETPVSVSVKQGEEYRGVLAGATASNLSVYLV